MIFTFKVLGFFYHTYPYNPLLTFNIMSSDRLTRALKKTLKRAKEDHKEKMDELELEDDSRNGCLGDW
jgi:hypothetical protein